jgi:hypothetical protein
MGGASADVSNSIAVDASGNIYTTGSFQDTADFDPGIGTYYTHALGGSDIFVSKLNSSGNFVWAKQMGGTYVIPPPSSGTIPSYAVGNSIAVDASGNVYTTGKFTWKVDFNPNGAPSDTFYLFTGTQNNLAFISKLDSFGNFVFAKQIGNYGDLYTGNSIAVDAVGNSYTGYFGGGPVDADFIRKLNALGDSIWTKQINYNSQYSTYSIAMDVSHNHLYTTGNFKGTVDFDPGPGIFNLTSFGNNDDIFISKLDTSGNFVWAKQMGGTYQDVPNSIAVNSYGNVSTTGYFQGTADFDPGSGTYNLTSGSYRQDIFVSKLDSLGNFVWAAQMKNHNDANPVPLGVGKSVTVDSFGNVYSTGYFNDTRDFEPGIGTYYLNSFGGNDIFVSKLDASGNFIWAKQMGGSSRDLANSIAIDAHGNVYTTGTFQGTADFDPSSGSFNLTSNGSDDIFVCKLDALGNFLWAKQMGGTLSDVGTSIALDTSGNAYITGNFQGTANFDPSSSNFTLTSTGNNDIFITKLDASGNFVWAKKIGGYGNDVSNSIALDKFGNTYSTGSFWGTVDFDPGIGTYNLIATGYADPMGTQRDSTDIFISKLDSSGNFVWAIKINGYNWFDQAYSITTDAIGNAYITGIEWSYTSSADIFPATVVSKIDALGNVKWAKQGGLQFYPNAETFYSIVVDTSMNVFTAGNSNSNVVVNKYDSTGNLVWVKQVGGTASDIGYSIAIDPCGDLFTTGSFQGTTNFNPSGTFNLTTASGATEIFVTKWGNSSNCQNATSVSQVSTQTDMTVYPNPTSGAFHIQVANSQQLLANSQIEIYNVLGEKVYSSHLTPAPSPSGEGWGEVVNMSAAPNGIYFLQLKTNDGIASKKIVINH